MCGKTENGRCQGCLLVLLLKMSSQLIIVPLEIALLLSLQQSLQPLKCLDSLCMQTDQLLVSRLVDSLEIL